MVPSRVPHFQVDPFLTTLRAAGPDYPGIAASLTIKSGPYSVDSATKPHVQVIQVRRQCEHMDATIGPSRASLFYVLVEVQNTGLTLLAWVTGYTDHIDT